MTPPQCSGTCVRDSHRSLETYTIASVLIVTCHPHRWVRRLKKRCPVVTRLAIEMYQIHMGYVDRFHKNCAMFRLRFKRCIRRYHRAIFMWYLALVLNNIIVLFGSLFANADELRRAKEASNVGYKHWFQNEMGNGLINEGMRLARAKKKNDATLRITSFCRLVIAKRHLLRLRAAEQQPAVCQLQSVQPPSTRRCQLQSLSQRRAPGRPYKRKRSTGRPAKNVCTLTVTHVPHPSPIHCHTLPYHHPHIIHYSNTYIHIPIGFF